MTDQKLFTSGKVRVKDWSKNKSLRTQNNTFKITKEDLLEEPTKKEAEEQAPIVEEKKNYDSDWDSVKLPENSTIVVLNDPAISTSLEDRMREATSYLSQPIKDTDENGKEITVNLNPNAISGIIGVLSAESGLIHGIVNPDETKAYGNKAGIGIAQWSNERRAGYEKAMEGKQPSLKNELAYFIEDVKQNRPLVWKALKEANTVDEAVDAMFRGYENGSPTAFATKDQMISTYTPAYERLGYAPYNYDQVFHTRLKYGEKARSLQS